MKKFDIEYVRGYIEKCGYILLSDAYINSSTKLSIECPEGHKFLAIFGNFKNRGSRCPVCAREPKAASQRVDFNLIKMALVI